MFKSGDMVFFLAPCLCYDIDGIEYSIDCNQNAIVVSKYDEGLFNWYDLFCNGVLFTGVDASLFCGGMI